jgi:hypothetical protein
MHDLSVATSNRPTSNSSSPLTPDSLNSTPSRVLYNPYAGRPNARQLSESVSSFLSRLPLSKSSSDELGPWIFIANPYTSHLPTSEDWAGFKTAGAELLSSLRREPRSKSSLLGNLKMPFGANRLQSVKLLRSRSMRLQRRGTVRLESGCSFRRQNMWTTCGRRWL